MLLSRSSLPLALLLVLSLVAPSGAEEWFKFVHCFQEIFFVCACVRVCVCVSVLECACLYVCVC